MINTSPITRLHNAFLFLPLKRKKKAKAPATPIKRNKTKTTTIIQISSLMKAPYNPGISKVNKFHMNSDNGTRYSSEIRPNELASEKPSITINVKVIRIEIIVIVRMIASRIK